ncbi:MAG TPA: hypothetical protein ENI88_06790 [Desulfobulbus sp.]|nr:hypothetical protein [Desulfobulbus sp.]
MKQNIDKHIATVSLIFIVLGIIYLLATAGLGIVGMIAARHHGQTVEIALLPAVLTGLIILLPLGLFGTLHILAGRAFRKGKAWARICIWILAAINLGNVPIGTATGIYAIWVLVKTRDNVKKMRP